MISIITGEQGVGKTTFLMKIIEHLEGKHSIGGIITPAVYAHYQIVGSSSANRVKTGFDALDLATGESWPLGRTNKKFEGLQFGQFSFSRKGFDRARDVVSQSLIRQDDFTILDEVGPLEYEKKEGFWILLPKLSKASHSTHIFIVVRPSLVSKTIEHYFANVFYRIIEVTAENRSAVNFLNAVLRAT